MLPHLVRRPVRIASLVGLLAIGLACRPASAQGGLRFKDKAGNDYAMERFPAKPDGTKRPVVVLVHGIDGLARFGPQMRDFADELAGKGYLVMLPNYFGTTNNAPQNGMPEDLLERLAAAVDLACDDADADKARVALVGYSLGAALSLIYAETNPARIKAVVDNYGPTDPKAPRMSGVLSAAWDILGGAAKLPPTLILHNEMDEIVTISHSEKLDAAPRKTGTARQLIRLKDGDPMIGFHPCLKDHPEDKRAKRETIAWLVKYL